MFGFDTKTSSPLELNVAPRTDANGAIYRFVVLSDDTLQAYAIYNRGWPTEDSGYILRLSLAGWEPLSGGLPNETFFALETDWTTQALYAASDASVYVSRDKGDTWKQLNDGLPRRPHCSDLRFVIDAGGSHYLYLSTWGRSIWRTRLEFF